MGTLFRIWLAFSAMAMPLAGGAAAQDASAFDGRYAGTSVVGRGDGPCRPVSPMPRPLRIRGGKAEVLMGAQGELVFTGPVGTDGGFTLKDDAGRQMTGKIGAFGTVTASVSGIAPGCTYALSWRYE